MLLDGCPGHIDGVIKKMITELRYDIEQLPPSTSGLVQPMDLPVNRSFKAHFSAQWEDFQLSLTENDVTNKGGKYLAPQREHKVRWASKAWEKVTKETVRNGFQIFWEQDLELSIIEESNSIQGDEEEEEGKNRQIPIKINEALLMKRRAATLVNTLIILMIVKLLEVIALKIVKFY